MPATEIRLGPRTEPASTDVRSWQRRFRALWAAALTGLLGLLFTGLTAVTIALWTTDPTYIQTNPVVDLAFFAVGGILVTAGLASQIRTPKVAGLQQTIVALVALSVAGWLGGRIEPLIGPAVLLVAAIPLVMFHPDRQRLLGLGAGMSRTLAVLTGVAAVPATVYAADMLERAQASGRSCLLGQCVQGDRYAEAAGLAIAVVLVALLASVRTPGWMLSVWSAGTGAAVLGVASLVFPAEVGALGGPWALASVIWGGAFPAIAHIQHRRPTSSARLSNGPQTPNRV